MSDEPSSPETIKAAFLNAAKLHQDGRIGEAAATYDRLLQMAPTHAQALRLRGICEFQQNRLESGIPFLERALAIKPDDAQCRADLAKALRGLHRYEDALTHYRRLLTDKPADAALETKTGDVLLALKRHGEAANHYIAALALGTESQDLLIKCAVALQSAGRNDEAVPRYERALALAPNDAETHHNLGVALAALDRKDEALGHYREAIALKPGVGLFHANLAVALKTFARHDEAVAAYGQALAIAPDLDFLLGAWIHTKMMVCDWDGIDPAFTRLAQGIERGEKVSSPFGVVATPLSGTLQRRCAEIYTRALYPAAAAPPPARKSADGRIRLGYFSGDLHDHPVGYLIAEMIELHDRARFEVFAFSFGPERKGPIRDRLRAGFDRFIDIRDMSDLDAVAFARAEGIDIAVDLMGYTGACRTDLFALRVAPLQVNYLGYPGTLGASYLDYLIADPTLIPEDQRSFYAEKIAYLPHSYQPNDSQRPVSDKRFKRADFGLPDEGFVFCCFNKNYKITPDVYDVWMRLLQRVDGSVLWIFEDTPAVARNLRRETAARGVNPDRLVFAHKMHALADYLARAKSADLFLDTLHYNAHTTASDALWAGLPVLTCPGRSFGSRVAAGLLTAVGMPMLIAQGLEDYERRAFELATNPQRLAEIKRTLRKNTETYPLFDTMLYTRHIDAAYSKMWERHRSGLPPDHFFVRPEV
jgi:protein O-GlcNAc transferase